MYRSLGISVDAVLSHMIDDERREAYAQQVVYGTMREFGFDFLRANLTQDFAHRAGFKAPWKWLLPMRPIHALIDEARLP